MARPRYARLITMHAKRGKGRRFRDTFARDVASSAKEIKGLRRLYLFRPVGKKDDFVALSLWDDEKSALAYVRSGRNRAYSDKLKGLERTAGRVRKLSVEAHVVGVNARSSD